MNAPPSMDSASDSDTLEQRPRVITVRFRLRTLCAVLAVPALVIAVAIVAVLWQVYQKARLNAAIQTRGGYVYTNYYSGNLPTAWLPWPGNRTGGTYTNITLDNCNVTDSWLAKHDLSRLSGELTVSLSGNPISDDGLRHLARYRRVSFMQLGETSITDDGLAHLRDCDDLYGLSLNDTAVTDAGLPHLDGLPQLSSLDVRSTAVTDAGILHVLRAHTISSLSIDASILTPEVATALTSKSVYQLTLHGNAVQDALSLLSSSTTLQHLMLDGDAVTDDCVPALTQLIGLKYLNLTNTRITRDGYDRLREALPGCEIYIWLNWEGEETE